MVQLHARYVILYGSPIHSNPGDLVYQQWYSLHERDTLQFLSIE